MKKVSLFITVLMMVFMLGGCTDSSLDNLKVSEEGGIIPLSGDTTDDTGDDYTYRYTDGVATEGISTEGIPSLVDGGSYDMSGDSVLVSGVVTKATSSSVGELIEGGEIEELTNGPQAGLMSASEWSDLLEYEFYLSLFEVSQDMSGGIFKTYFDKGYFDTLHMVKVKVESNEVNLNGAVVALLNSQDEVIYKATSNANGFAYLFPQTDQLDLVSNLVTVYDGQVLEQDYIYSVENNTLTIEVNTQNITHEDIIEIMFVIDTTGSMGDEIAFFKAEIDYVIDEISIANPESIIKLALLFYRDNSDNYVTRYFDFTTDIASQKENLEEQSARGGGDFPEAVDVALEEAINKNWSEGNTTKLLVHVLDAPPHYNQEDMTRYYDALFTASEKGIRVIPIASSGIDKYTEYLLRNSALMTGGTYIFITNDSGIGGSHIEATVGETEVEYLNQLLIRVINEFHTGVEGFVIPYSSNPQQ